MKTISKRYGVKAIGMIALVTVLISSTKAQAQTDCTYGTKLNSIDHFLDSIVASNWITHYESYIDSLRQGMVKPSNILFADPSESFNRRLIQQILDIQNCIGERIYMGINDNQKIVVIIGGVDSCGNTLYITDDNVGTKPQLGGMKSMHLFKQKAGGDKGLGEYGINP